MIHSVLIFRYVVVMANDSLKRAVEIAGGQKPLADLIGTSQSQVWYWLEKSKRGVPAEFCLKIEAATGVSRHEQRPDIFPPIGEAAP